MTALVAAGCAMFGYADTLALAMIAYWGVRIGRNVIDPTLTVWVVRHTEPGVRATVLSMQGQSHSIGEIVAGPTVGTVGRLISVPAALVTSGIIEACALPLLAREASRAPAEAPSEPTSIDPTSITPGSESLPIDP
jgi:hypothetical protein